MHVHTFIKFQMLHTWVLFCGPLASTVQLISNLMLASTHSQAFAFFLVHSIKTRMYDHLTRVFIVSVSSWVNSCAL